MGTGRTSTKGSTRCSRRSEAACLHALAHMTDTAGMVKIGLHAPDGEFETMWATPVGPDRYRLENSPFYAYGVSWLDVVEALPDEAAGLPVFVRRVERSGHRTVRLILLP